MIQEHRTKLNNTIKYGTQVSLNYESKKKKKVMKNGETNETKQIVRILVYYDIMCQEQNREKGTEIFLKTFRINLICINSIGLVGALFSGISPQYNECKPLSFNISKLSYMECGTS